VSAFSDLTGSKWCGFLWIVFGAQYYLRGKIEFHRILEDGPSILQKKIIFPEIIFPENRQKCIVF